MNRPSPTAKGAELASGLGAVVLGAGLALLAPELLRQYALALLAVGLMVHGAGMTLKYRLESGERALLAWERAVFWLCWIMLSALASWLIARALAS
jgi:hypothetical protein